MLTRLAARMIASFLRTRRNNSSVRMIERAVSKSSFFAVVILALTTLNYQIMPSISFLRSTQHQQSNEFTSVNQRSTSEVQRSTSESFSPLNVNLASFHKYPRVLALSATVDSSTTKIIIKEDPLSSADLINITESYINSVLNELYINSSSSTSEQYTDTCVPMASWQTQTYPTCNTVHEIDLLVGVINENDQNDPYYAEEAPPFIIHYIGKGGSRLVFRTAFRGTEDQFALKVFRIDRAFEPHVFEYHRIDAIASEQLTSAPDVMDIYGFCGMTALNELSSGYNMGHLLRSKIIWEPLEILEIMLQASLSLAHVHNIPNDVDNRNNISLVHNDVTENNFVISMNATLKMSDFNRAVPLRWNKTSNEGCGFLQRRLGGAGGLSINSPPETTTGAIRLTEKIDVYALGRLIFEFLSWHTLFYYELYYDEELSYSNKSMEEKVLQLITNPEKQPQLPQSVENSTDPVILGLVSVMRQTLQYNASDRPSAQDVANELEGLYNSTDQRAEVVRTLYYKMPDVLVQQFGSRGRKQDGTKEEDEGDFNHGLESDDASENDILATVKGELLAAKYHLANLESILRQQKKNLKLDKKIIRK